MTNKTTWKPGTLLAPLPAVMVTCQGNDNKPNIITIAWVGVVNSEPPMVSISVRPSRHSNHLIRESGEFVINVPGKKQVRETDICGVISGSKENKFHETGLTPGKSNTVKAPIIMECPINLECKVKQEIKLDSHDVFIAEITSVQVSSECIDKDGKFDLNKADLLGFAHGTYVSLGKQVGTFGYSVKKK